jgi:hypothetical protein
MQLLGLKRMNFTKGGFMHIFLHYFTHTYVLTYGKNENAAAPRHCQYFILIYNYHIILLLETTNFSFQSKLLHFILLLVLEVVL